MKNKEREEGKGENIKSRMKEQGGRKTEEEEKGETNKRTGGRKMKTGEGGNKGKRSEEGRGKVEEK